MIKELKGNFFQITSIMIIWVYFLSTFSKIGKVDYSFFGRIILIGLLFGLTFGVIYTYLWKYSTFKAITNIIISSLVNLFCGLLSVYLFSKEMFNFIFPYIYVMVIIVFIGHIIGFYFYSKHENKVISDELNKVL
ncbi:hypothetical protein [Floricoccus penangensis]|uniref:hypothetical protein n=1 Tax=Floricoccus penangensis TaxID=1859475 RepID=UPI00203DAE64|nr:hypothetical protein [Floricoccus penangensis]URZ86958.1 hypothetical protein KIW23_07690 [Floricoccus penangensis]